MTTASSTLLAMQNQPTVTGTVKVRRAEEGSIDVAVPGTTYSIRLQGTGTVGDRCEGFIEATAMKVHVASGGGRFIQPAHGEPRIVAGHVVAMDADGAGAVVRSVVPVHVRFEDPASAASIEVGDLVNFHVRSGASWLDATSNA